MSNTLALATLVALLESRITTLTNANGLASVTVSTDHPRGEMPDAGVYIKPYHIQPNASLSNDDLPTRRGDGTLLKRPRLAINVHILLSFVGSGSYEAERLAGLVLTHLHAHPVITQQEIGDYLAVLSAEDPLAAADLGDQLERVKLTPLWLNVEDLSRVWGLFNQSFYGLSVAYEASVILLDSDVQPSHPLPVAATNVGVIPSVAPQLTEVRSSERRQPIVLLGESLVLRGTSLKGEVTQIRVGQQTFLPSESAFTPGQVTLPVTAGMGIPAGVHAVQIVHRLRLDGTPASERTVASSGALVMALAPSISSLHATGGLSTYEIRLVSSPPPSPDQDVALMLDKVGGGEHHLLTEWHDDAGTLVFSTSEASAGVYLVRLRIDGAISIPVPAGAGGFDTPEVTLP